MKVEITLHDEFKNADVTLLTIYDKEEIDNVSDNYIKWLVSEAQK